MDGGAVSQLRLRACGALRNLAAKYHQKMNCREFVFKKLAGLPEVCKLLLISASLVKVALFVSTTNSK
ncbi:MAG: hypothetical protein DU480_06510 [Nitrosomonas sp.]